VGAVAKLSHLAQARLCALGARLAKAWC
jgi:hypothetical protein